MLQPSRFDYVRYDEIAAEKQVKLKAAAQRVESLMFALNSDINEMGNMILAELPKSSALKLALDELTEAGLCEDSLQRLEQSYMWVGKGIRDDQIARNGSAPLEESRGNT